MLMLWDKLYSTYRLYTVFRLSYDVLWQVVKHSCDYMSHDPHKLVFSVFSSLLPQVVAPTLNKLTTVLLINTGSDDVRFFFQQEDIGTGIFVEKGRYRSPNLWWPNPLRPESSFRLPESWGGEFRALIVTYESLNSIHTSVTGVVGLPEESLWED